jgi:hypothetical protein
VSPSAPAGSLRRQLAEASAEQRRPLLLHHLCSAVARVLGLPAPGQIDPRQGLMEMGLNSLMAVDLKRQLETGLETALPATFIFESPTIERLSEYLYGLCCQ